MKRALTICSLAFALLIVNGCKSNAVVGTWEVESYQLGGEDQPNFIGKEVSFKSDDTFKAFFGEGTYEFKDNVVVCKGKFEITMTLKDGKLSVKTPIVEYTLKKK
jgi:hypothetical protein